jgi:hypothetical protein
MGELSCLLTESLVPAAWYLRLLRRHRKNAARARATTPRVAPTEIPAMAPDDRPVLPLASLVDSLVDSLLEESEVSVLVVEGTVESEPVVAVVASVDEGGCCFNQQKNLSRGLKQENLPQCR